MILLIHSCFPSFVCSVDLVFDSFSHSHPFLFHILQATFNLKFLRCRLIGFYGMRLVTLATTLGGYTFSVYVVFRAHTLTHIIFHFHISHFDCSSFSWKKIQIDSPKLIRKLFVGIFFFHPFENWTAIKTMVVKTIKHFDEPWNEPTQKTKLKRRMNNETELLFEKQTGKWKTDEEIMSILWFATGTTCNLVRSESVIPHQNICFPIECGYDNELTPAHRSKCQENCFCFSFSSSFFWSSAL